MHASLHLHTSSFSRWGFVCSLITLACEQTGYYLNWGFINRPVYCCRRQRELTHLPTCTKKRSGDVDTHYTSCCQIHWSTLIEGCLCPPPLSWVVPLSTSFYCFFSYLSLSVTVFVPLLRPFLCSRIRGFACHGVLGQYLSLLYNPNLV